MGRVLAFPGRSPADSGLGTVHVWAPTHGRYEVGHESSSGNSWGGFDTFTDPQQAIEAAYRLARDTYDGCAVWIAKAVSDALPDTGSGMI